MQLFFPVLLAQITLFMGLPQQGNTPQTTQPPAAAAAIGLLLNEVITSLRQTKGQLIRFRVETKNGVSTVVSEGRSIRGEGKKVRAEITVTQSGRQVSRKIICDGVTLHQFQTAGAEPVRESYTLEELDKTLNDLAKTETDNLIKEDMKAELEGRTGREGPIAMLLDLQKNMNFGEAKPVVIDCYGRGSISALSIQGEWKKEYLTNIAPPKRGDNPKEEDREYLWKEKMGYLGFPRKATIYFDASTKVPLRIDMVGPLVKQGPDETIIRSDFLEVKDLPPTELTNLCKLTAEEEKIEPKPIDLAKRLKDQHLFLTNAMEKQRELEKAKRDQRK